MLWQLVDSWSRDVGSSYFIMVYYKYRHRITGRTKVVEKREFL